MHFFHKDGTFNWESISTHRAGEGELGGILSNAVLGAKFQGQRKDRLSRR
jgi:hypothetical protein